MKGHADIVSLLIAHNADVNAVAKLGPTAQKNKVCLHRVKNVFKFLVAIKSAQKSHEIFSK